MKSDEVDGVLDRHCNEENEDDINLEVDMRFEVSLKHYFLKIGVVKTTRNTMKRTSTTKQRD